MPEPAGVHRDGRQQPGRHLGRERRAQSADACITRIPVASAAVSFEEDRAQVVLADVVVDDHPRAAEIADEPRHVAELVPRREVEDHQRPRGPPSASGWTVRLKCSKSVPSGSRKS